MVIVANNGKKTLECLLIKYQTLTESLLKQEYTNLQQNEKNLCWKLRLMYCGLGGMIRLVLF